MYQALTVWIATHTHIYFGFSRTVLKSSKTEQIGYALSPSIQTYSITLLYISALRHRDDVMCIYNQMVEICRKVEVILLSGNVNSTSDTIRFGRSFTWLVIFLVVASLAAGTLSIIQSYLYMESTYGPETAKPFAAVMVGYYLLQNMYVVYGMALLSFVTTLQTLYGIMTRLALSQKDSNTDPTSSLLLKAPGNKGIDGLLIRFVLLSQEMTEMVQEINKKFKMRFILILLSLLVRIIFTLFMFVVNLEQSRFGTSTAARLLELVYLSATLYAFCSRGTNLSLAVMFYVT